MNLKNYFYFVPLFVLFVSFTACEKENELEKLTLRFRLPLNEILMQSILWQRSPLFMPIRIVLMKLSL